MSICRVVWTSETGFWNGESLMWRYETRRGPPLLTGCSLHANYNPPSSHTFNVLILDHINTHSQIWLRVSQRVSWCHWTLRAQLTHLHSCTLHRSTQMKGGLHWFLLQESDEHPTRRPCTLTWETPSRGWVSRGKYRPLMRTSLMQPADRKTLISVQWDTYDLSFHL